MEKMGGLKTNQLKFPAINLNYSPQRTQRLNKNKQLNRRVDLPNSVERNARILWLSLMKTTMCPTKYDNFSTDTRINFSFNS
jgi:hypothetical protein